jgi:P-type Cu+ transporter
MSSLDTTGTGHDIVERPVPPVELRIGGMTCASCATRIENKLNRMPGVSAGVNYATDNAWVMLPEGTSVADAIATVEVGGVAVPPRRLGERPRR